ncbi:hypothetical protein D9758_000144 [Tetrapyrgos nigripes]|uniref:Uncharacterized protein n=1 Tax=Tetrapyrgos nigripes TaxID=182062 RepID=A0A8H5H1T4_9AGAR|nr:hypothetical protein D9758_000144 [Tetrapyrgos nigripes]
MSNNTISAFRLLLSLASSSTSPILSISLSDDAAIEQLLSDIPNCMVFCFFGVSTFWLFMRKRVNLLAILIYLATFLAFLAGILDLIQILARGPVNIDKGLGIDTSITVVMNTREVLLSLGRGAIFLFFWQFIAEKPRGEPPPNPMLATNNRTSYGPRDDTHSASWRRWGVLGWILQYGLLLASVSIPVLQIIWRIINSDTIYVVESTIEVIVTGLFLLKVFLNIFLSPLTPWWKPFRFYMIPILALLFNLALSIGNLLSDRFTDTTLGRFLQAVELYILILFVMINAFYKVPTRPPRSRRSKGTSSFINQKPRDFSLPPPVLMGGGGGGGSGSGDAKDAMSPYFTTNVDAPITRSSRISRLSDWMIPRRNSVFERSAFRSSWRDSPDSEGRNSEVVDTVPRTSLDKLVPQPQPDRTELPTLSAKPSLQQLAIKSEPSTSFRVPTPDPAPVATVVPTPLPIAVPVPAPVPSPVPSPRAKSPSTIAPSFPPSPSPATARDSRPSTTFSFSYYGMERGSRRSLVNPPFMEAASRQDTPSPIYGLNGIINVPPEYRDSGISLNNRGSGNSFDELLRQQTELDKSIAALRLFSPQSDVTTFEESDIRVPAISSPPRSPLGSPGGIGSQPELPEFLRKESSSGSERVKSSTTRSSSQKHDSASEFSLSIFPEPPAPASLTPTRASFAALRSQRNSLTARRADVPSLAPTSPNQVGVRTDRFGSNGTQYDVTSFIGDLTSPGTGLRPGSTFKNSGLSDVESEDEGSTSFVEESARPLMLASAVPMISKVPTSRDSKLAEQGPATASSGIASPTQDYPVLKPFLLGNVTSYPSVSSPLAAQSRVSGPRRPARGRLALPSQPRLAISAPRPRESSLGESEDQYRYERPRKPPALNLSPVDTAP